jgi:GDPmannose 4,6-dehydratase
MKKALITGITGQDGSYLAEFLCNNGYRVFGLTRRQSNPNLSNIAHLLGKIEIISGDMTDQPSLESAIKDIMPDEVYNLAAQSHVHTSWKQPILTNDINALGTMRLLDAIRTIKPDARFYQASSSEMFGKVVETPQTEKTPFYPRSPYGISKVSAHYLTVNYRESYGMFACSGICFNHESPRRGLEFVTRKIVHEAVKISKGKSNELRLGNIESRRDWGFAGDYVEAMWMILQHHRPKDYIISTGETHSVREFLELTFSLLNMDYRDYIKIDDSLIRPAEVDILMGDNTKIKSELGWFPKVNFKSLVSMMVNDEIKSWSKNNQDSGL